MWTFRLTCYLLLIVISEASSKVNVKNELFSAYSLDSQSSNNDTIELLADLPNNRNYEIIFSKDSNNQRKRILNTAPTFTTELQSLTITYCRTISYLLPSVVDSEGDNYSITATLYDGSLLPNWIYFDTRKVVILLPKGTNPNGNYDLKIRLTDSKGLSTDYKLTIIVDTNPLQFMIINDIVLVSPQNLIYTYNKILKNSYNYDLNSSISLIDINNSLLPYWITEEKSEYKCNINSSFNPKETLEFSMRFQVEDYCRDKFYTNIFKLTVLPNKPPYVNHIPPNATFYKGQDTRTIPTPTDMFVDPGDSFSVYTTLCLEKDSQSLRTYFNESGNYIYNTIYIEL